MGTVAHPVSKCDIILVHLNKFASRGFSEYNMPYSLTQDGIANALGISRAHASLELKKLRERDLVENGLAHVTEKGVKRNVYYLKPLGMSKAHDVEDYLKNHNIPVETLFIDSSIREISPKDPELSAAMNDIEIAGEMLRNITKENVRYNRTSALRHVTNAVKHIAMSMEVFQ